MSENYERRQELINRNRLSVKKLGVGLAGLDGVNQKVPVHSSTRALLINAIKNSGCVKINVKSDALMGSHIETKGVSQWGEKLDAAAKTLTKNDPCYLVLFRDAKDCLIATFVPDDAKPKQKMLYASSKESLKDAIIELDGEISLEEFNVADPSDLNFANYSKKMNAPKPWSQQELQRQEEDTQEHAGNYGILARLMQVQNGTSLDNRDVIKGDANAKPMALPGMAGGFDISSARMSLKPTGKIQVNKSDIKGVTNEVQVPAKKVSNVKASFNPVNKEMADLLKPTVKAKVSGTALLSVEEDDNKTVVIKEVNDKEMDLEFEVDIVEDEDEDMNNNMDLKSNIATAVPTEDGFDEENMVSNVSMDGSKLPPAGNAEVETRKKPKRKGFLRRLFGGLFFKKRFVPKELTPEEIAAQDASDGVFGYGDLKQMKEEGNLGDLDATKLESYVSSQEFAKLAGISKADFYKTNPKEQNKVRKQLGLL